MATEFLTALALILVIEGVLYALFPNAMRRMLAQIMTMPAGRLRIAGLASAIVGVVLVALLRR